MDSLPTRKTTPLFRRILHSLGKALLFAVLGLLFIWILSLPASLLVTQEQANALANGDMEAVSIWVLLLLYLIYTVGSLLSLFIVRKLVSRQSLVSAGLGTIRWPKEFGEGWILGTLLVFAGYLLMVLTGMASSQGWFFALSSFLPWLLFFLIQPFLEELLFRGYLMSLLTRYFDIWTALIISSLGFALVHGANESFSLLGFITICLAGLLFGMLFLKTGRLWLPTGLHAAWNFTQGVVFGFPTSGISTYSITQTSTSGPDWLTGGGFGLEGSILAVLLIMAAIWWYRSSFREEQLSTLIEQSFDQAPQTAENIDILDQNS